MARLESTEASSLRRQKQSSSTLVLASPAVWSPHCAGLAQFPDRGVVIAGFAKDLVGMLADAGRAPRLDLVAAVDPDRAVDREHGIVVERNQHLVLDHLPVVRNVVENPDHAEYQAVAVEDGSPFDEIFAGKD